MKTKTEQPFAPMRKGQVIAVARVWWDEAEVVWGFTLARVVRTNREGFVTHFVLSTRDGFPDATPRKATQGNTLGITACYDIGWGAQSVGDRLAGVVWPNLKAARKAIRAAYDDLPPPEKGDLA